MAVLVRTRRLSNPSYQKLRRKGSGYASAQYRYRERKLDLSRMHAGQTGTSNRKRKTGNPSGRYSKGKSHFIRRDQKIRLRERINELKQHRPKLPNYGTREGQSWSTFSKTKTKTKKKKNPGRRMSLAQKLHFGTARQRAAARLSLSGRRNPGYKKLRKRGLHMTAQYRYRVKSKLGRGGYTSNPKRRKEVRQGITRYYNKRGLQTSSRGFKKTKRGKNIGEIVSISLAGLNPGKKRRKTTMARSRRRRRVNAGGYKRRRTRRANPARSYRRRRVSAVRHRRRRSNPGMHRRRRRNPVYAMRRINRGRRRNPFGLEGVTSGTIGKALGVIGGAIGSKYLTQLALGGNNTGVMGYGGNLVASIALGWAAGKVTKSKDFGVMVTVGGIAALVLRVLQDNTSIGQYVNLSLAGMGKAGDMGLGIIQDSSFPVPQVAVPGSMNSFVVPRQTRMAITAAQAQTAAMKTAGSGGMGRMQGRMARRAIM